MIRPTGKAPPSNRKGALFMNDEQIVNLYWARDEAAIRQTQDQYGRYLAVIAANVLSNRQDEEECVNDTYLRAWNSMPSDRPQSLAAYLGRITRNLAIDMYRKLHTAKREGSTYEASLEELAECVGTQDPAETQLGAEALGEAISVYLRSLDQQKRQIFISRYFFLDRCADIAEKAGIPEGSVRSILSRTRKGLKNYLEKEGFVI